MSEKFYPVHLGPAKCAVDLGDGSERGEYVDQDYILQKLGRPHRSISLMYCYYPYDAEWPARISEAWKDKNVSFAWDYPYDDYFPYEGGLNGRNGAEAEPFKSMRDVRRHGQDVTLTLTLDPKLTDDHLIAIANDLKKFGRMMLRINHEATGNWFSFNKRASYQEVADFFVHAANVIRTHAPNVSVILCIDGIQKLGDTEIDREAEFSEAVRAADLWSTDKYPSLHWGWPYDVAEEGGTTFKRTTVRENFDLIKATCERFTEINGGVPKPMMVNEMNADGDVTGPYEQAMMVKEFGDMLKAEQADWFRAFTMYQFRDRGRLGLEIEDPNNPQVGIEQPLLKVYRDMIREEYFSPTMTLRENELSLPVTLRWGGSEDADGIGIPLHFEGNPHFCELYFDETDESNLMIELGGRWFYKAPKTRVLDLMGTFFEKPLTGPADLTLHIFAPPASGENDLAAEDGLMNTYTTLTTLPRVRIRYAPILPDPGKK
ncbi:MAG: hypothetical protein J5825_08105 [Lachnospiraceae bacterium]|nr:hypothetical protein [Lachnospiraceae bacterium]